MSYSSIKNSVDNMLKNLPNGVKLVAAAKTRSSEEVQAAIDGGVSILGYNYLQEAERIHQDIGNSVQWHMIGHLQKNKVKKAVRLFNMIETVDNRKLAAVIDAQCAKIDKIMPVLIEVNSGREHNKTGVFPENVIQLIREISSLENIKIQGLMTMGPLFAEPEQFRKYFRETKLLFEQIKVESIASVEMRFLSMGMSESYQIAIEEGANIVRIGTLLFGRRNKS